MSEKYDMRFIVLWTLFGLLCTSTLLEYNNNKPDSTPLKCYSLDKNAFQISQNVCSDRRKTIQSPWNNPNDSLFHFAPVPINHASAELLETIIGVGPELSQKILNSKESEGPFTGIESIKKLPGVGDKKANYLATQFTYDE